MEKSVREFFIHHNDTHSISNSGKWLLIGAHFVDTKKDTVRPRRVDNSGKCNSGGNTPVLDNSGKCNSENTALRHSTQAARSSWERYRERESTVESSALFSSVLHLLLLNCHLLLHIRGP